MVRILDRSLGNLARCPLEIRQRIYSLSFAYEYPQLAHNDTIHSENLLLWTAVDNVRGNDHLPSLVNVNKAIRTEAFLPFVQTNVLELTRVDTSVVQHFNDYVRDQGIAQSFASIVRAVSIDAAEAFDKTELGQWKDRVSDISNALQAMTNVREVTVKTTYWEGFSDRIEDEEDEGSVDLDTARAESLSKIFRQVAHLRSLRHVRLWEEAHLSRSRPDNGSRYLYLRSHRRLCESVWAALLDAGCRDVRDGSLTVTLEGHCGRNWRIDPLLVGGAGQMILPEPKELDLPVPVCKACIGCLNRMERSISRREAHLEEKIKRHFEAERRELGRERVEYQRLRQFAVRSGAL